MKMMQYNYVTLAQVTEHTRGKTRTVYCLTTIGITKQITETNPATPLISDKHKEIQVTTTRVHYISQVIQLRYLCKI